MIVRDATRDDIPRIVEMARQFYAQTTYAAIVPLADESAAGLAVLMMDAGVMLVAEEAGAIVGMVGLFIEPFTFNITKTSATEIVWWVDPVFQNKGAGKALLAAIEPACRGRGADMIRMMCLTPDGEVAAAVYQRMGYLPTENAFTKVL